MKLTARMRRRMGSGVSCLLIGCLAVCLVGGERGYEPPSSPPQRPHDPGSPNEPLDESHLSRLLNDSQLSQLLDDPDLWLILKKRLGGGGPGGPDQCTADRRRNGTIIKTKDSLDAGAAFISSPSATNSRECAKECCKEKTCNTAVVNLRDSQNGERIACYLFDCKNPSICIFTSHPGFIVLEFDSENSVDRHGDELDKLVASNANSPSVSTTISSTTSSITTTSTTTTTATTTKARQIDNDARKNFVGLFSECHRSSDCSDRNTDCTAGYCICQPSFHVVDMQCRKDCDQELEFECSNKNSPLSSECIAVYDYCDGIPQCSDGSDETSCLDSSKHRGDGQHGGRARDRGRLQPPGENKSTVAELLPVSSKIEPAVPVSSSTTVMPPESTSPDGRGKTSAMVKVSPAHHELSSADQKQTSGQDDEATEKKEELYFWKMQKNLGAIVALALGIILTTTLLILAGCRLRNFRKRYRKGRHLNSNDADYLINGMYL